jgi:hypothetical protein
LYMHQDFHLVKHGINKGICWSFFHLCWIYWSYIFSVTRLSDSGLTHLQTSNQKNTNLRSILDCSLRFPMLSSQCLLSTNFMLDLQFLYYVLCAPYVFNIVNGQEFLMRSKLTVYGLEGVHGSILRYGICLVVLLGLY